MGSIPSHPLTYFLFLYLMRCCARMVLKKTSFIKNLHHHIKCQIERKVGKYATQVRTKVAMEATYGLLGLI